MDPDTAAIGDQIRARRQALDLTQGELADRSGVSKAMICDIECGKKNPTIRLLGQLAAGLGVGISDLLEVDETPRFISDRRAQQRTLVDPENGMERRVISPAMLRRGIEIIEYTYPPGADCGCFPPHYHGVYEAAFVIEGRVRMEIGSDTIELGPGDSVTYAADVEHCATNIGEPQARVMYASDPTQARRGCAPPPTAEHKGDAEQLPAVNGGGRARILPATGDVSCASLLSFPLRSVPSPSDRERSNCKPRRRSPWGRWRVCPNWRT